LADFRGLRVWQEAHWLVLAIYDTTSRFPAVERYHLAQQLRRAAASIPANIAEGMGKSGDRERSRYINIALGSSSEVRYHILLARDLGLVDSQAYDELSAMVERVGRMLHALFKRLRKDVPARRR